MTREQHERLKKYDKWFHTAVRAQYITTLTARQVNELVEIATPLGVKLQHKSCPVCLYDFMVQLGRLYFAYKEEPVVVQPKKVEPKVEPVAVEPKKEEPKVEEKPKEYGKKGRKNRKKT